ncbi:hypothetical protein V5O48_000845 [Marasmius crinis-equi]|uniref:FLZ-type domain-containing protein n=1 Tax=Marasmius crinis-equi TaxID=585013 RepID=A0ABR3G052_9AGAR
MLSSISCSSSSTSSNDYHTQWCPVCDRIIVPKRTLVPVQPDIPVLRKKANPRPRGFVEGTGAFNNKGQQPARMRTVIDQGPFPLYCSEECKLQDMRGRHDEDSDRYHYTYPLYGVPNSPSDVESVSTSDDSLSSPTEEVSRHSQRPSPPDEDFLPMVPPRRPYALGANRSKSYHHGASPAVAISSSSAPTPTHHPSSMSRSPSSLPNDADELLSKFSQSFSRRSESRMSLYGGGSPPGASSLSCSPSRRERPLLPQGAEGKLAVPDVLVRVPSTTSMPSRPSYSRRNSSTSINSNFSRTGSISSFGSMRPSPLSQFGEDTEESEEEDFEEPPRSPASVSGYPAYPKMRRPVFETRSYSNDNFRTITQPSVHKQRRSLIGGGGDSISGSGKRLFLFPTD